MEKLQLSWDIITYIGLAVLGQLAHVLVKLTQLEKMKDFSFSLWIYKNIFGTSFGFLASVLLVFWLYGKGSLDMSTAIMMGFVADSAIKDLSKKYRKNLK